MGQAVGYQRVEMMKRGTYCSEAMDGTMIGIGDLWVAVFVVHFRTKFDYLSICLLKMDLK